MTATATKPKAASATERLAEKRKLVDDLKRRAAELGADERRLRQRRREVEYEIAERRADALLDDSAKSDVSDLQAELEEIAAALGVDPIFADGPAGKTVVQRGKHGALTLARERIASQIAQAEQALEDWRSANRRGLLEDAHAEAEREDALRAEFRDLVAQLEHQHRAVVAAYAEAYRGAPAVAAARTIPTFGPSAEFLPDGTPDSRYVKPPTTGFMTHVDGAQRVSPWVLLSLAAGYFSRSARPEQEAI